MLINRKREFAVTKAGIANHANIASSKKAGTALGFPEAVSVMEQATPPERTLAVPNRPLFRFVEA